MLRPYTEAHVEAVSPAFRFKFHKWRELPRLSLRAGRIKISLCKNCWISVHSPASGVPPRSAFQGKDCARHQTSDRAFNCREAFLRPAVSLRARDFIFLLRQFRRCRMLRSGRRRSGTAGTRQKRKPAEKTKTRLYQRRFEAWSNPHTGRPRAVRGEKKSADSSHAAKTARIHRRAIARTRSASRRCRTSFPQTEGVAKTSAVRGIPSPFRGCACPRFAEVPCAAAESRGLRLGSRATSSS